MSAQLSPPIRLAAPGDAKPKNKDDATYPTVLAILSASTREERQAKGADGKPSTANVDCARRLHELMMTWARHHEPVYREADENREFDLGRHYGYYSPALNLRVMIPEATNANVVRYTWNYIRRGVNRGLSILLADPPIIKCIAGDSGIIDQAAGEAADAVVEWRQRRTILAGDAERVARNAFVSGWSWVHSEWNSSLGPIVPLTDPSTGKPQLRPVADPETGQFQIDPATGAPKMEVVTGPQGDFDREVLEHRQGVPDPIANHPFRGSGFFVRKRMSRFDVARMFPTLDLSMLRPDTGEAMKRVADLGRGITSSSTSVLAGPSQKDKDEIEVDVFYAPKMEICPKGARVVFIEQACLEETDNPRYPTDEQIAKGEEEPNPAERPCWPVFPFVHQFRAQSAFGYSPVHDAIQPNKAINGLGSGAMNHAAKNKAKWKAPDNLAQELTDETAQVIKVPRRGFDHNSLGAVPNPPLDAVALQLWERNRMELYDFLGLNDPALGQQETTGQSGYSIRLRQQTAASDLEQTRQRHNAMWAEVFDHELFLFATYADTKRKIDVVGPNKRAALLELDKTAITAGTRVMCVNDASVPRNPQERMLFFKDFMASGVMKLPPQQRQRMFQFLRLHDVYALEEAEEGDRMRARRQIQRIMDDRDPGQVSDMDDHLVQMDVIKEFGLSEEFEAKVEAELSAELPPPPPQAPGMPPAPPPQPTSPTFARLTALWNAHKQALLAQQEAQTQGQVKEMMNFKDLPPEGQKQMAGQAGIKLSAKEDVPTARAA